MDMSLKSAVCIVFMPTDRGTLSLGVLSVYINESCDGEIWFEASLRQLRSHIREQKQTYGK